MAPAGEGEASRGVASVVATAAPASPLEAGGTLVVAAGAMPLAPTAVAATAGVTATGATAGGEALAAVMGGCGDGSTGLAAALALVLMVPVVAGMPEAAGSAACTGFLVAECQWWIG